MKTVSMLMALALVPAVPVLAQTPQTAPDCHEHHQEQAAAPSQKVPEIETVSDLNVPDVPVLDQDGTPKRFYTDLVKDKVVAVNFVFTTCTTICPPMGANFAKLQKLLGERAGRDVHLISVSVDPSTDTPERMKAWGQKFGAGPGWTLVTGDREEITRLLKSLGVFTASISDHSPLVLMGNDARRQWTRAYGLAAPAKLADLIGGMASPAADKNAQKESRP